MRSAASLMLAFSLVCRARDPSAAERPPTVAEGPPPALPHLLAPRYHCEDGRVLDRGTAFVARDAEGRDLVLTAVADVMDEGCRADRFEARAIATPRTNHDLTLRVVHRLPV